MVRNQRLQRALKEPVAFVRFGPEADGGMRKAWQAHPQTLVIPAVIDVQHSQFRRFRRIP
jgi:hypothetical protein